jgi:hypothetical protein
VSPAPAERAALLLLYCSCAPPPRCLPHPQSAPLYYCFTTALLLLCPTSSVPPAPAERAACAAGRTLAPRATISSEMHWKNGKMNSSKPARSCVCVCVCVRERERERECVSVCACVCVCQRAVNAARAASPHAVYYCFTTALLLLYYCFTTGARLRRAVVVARAACPARCCALLYSSTFFTAALLTTTTCFTLLLLY